MVAVKLSNTERVQRAKVDVAPPPYSSDASDESQSVRPSKRVRQTEVVLPSQRAGLSSKRPKGLPATMRDRSPGLQSKGQMKSSSSAVKATKILG